MQNLSQLQLAKKLDVSQQMVSSIENGYGNPSIQTLERIADALKLNLIIEFR